MKQRLQIWDTSGQEKFRSISPLYYRDADGFVLVYSLEDPKSFDAIEEYWLPSIQNFGPEKVKIALVGIQGDKPSNDESLTMSNQKLTDFIELNEIRIWSIVTFDNIPAITEIFHNLAASMIP